MEGRRKGKREGRLGAGRKEKKKGESEREKRQANAFTAFKVDLIFKMHFWIMFSEPVSCS